MSLIHRIPALLVGGMLALACGGQTKPPEASLPTTHDVFGDKPPSKCARPPAEPDLAAWDSHARGLLANQRRFGAIVVRYESRDCNVELEVLPNCIADLRDDVGKIVRYDYGPYFASERKIIHDKNELFAGLPLGAVSFQGAVGEGQSLRADLAHVGVASLPPETVFRYQHLRGSECQRATHIVARVYLGAFAMAAGNTQELEAAVTVFGAGAGGSSRSGRSVKREEGDLAECKAAKADGKEHAGCAVPLRLGLAEIEGAARAKPKTDDEHFNESACGRACNTLRTQCASTLPKLDMLECAYACDRHFDPDRPKCKTESLALIGCMEKQTYRGADACPKEAGIYPTAQCDAQRAAFDRCRTPPP